MRTSAVVLCYFIPLYLFLFSFIRQAEAVAQADSENGIYIVYMGAAAAGPNNERLGSMLARKKNTVLHSYKHGFSGFAARLSKEEALTISHRPGVVSVFPDPLIQLHTTRSWDFLKYQTDLKIDVSPSSESSGSSYSDTIVGILDTGIWPESDSFNDKDMGPIPSRWKGKCMEGFDFTSSSCNRKLIGARYYNAQGAETSKNNSPRDTNGHGTHVASTIAGSAVSDASYYGLAQGTAKGGSPSSRIAMYRVCGHRGCRGSDIMAAFDDAIGDGVDVLSLSLGASSGYSSEFSSDPIAIGAFHAVEKGIIVVCSAGNDGPYSESVVNVAPWILTVAATTIDRDFEADILLGGNKVIKGGGINFGTIQKTPIYPLIYGSAAKMNSDDSNEGDSRYCQPGTLDGDTIKGKIVLCERDNDYSGKEKIEVVKEQGGIGMILIDDDERSVASTYGSFSASAVSSNDGREIISYINSTGNPVATILPTVSLTNYKPAPIVAYFSSRGPSFVTRNLLKPDIAAPGVNILAAWPGNDSALTLTGKQPPLFNVLSGTSMACPHVSAIAATLKSRYPNWSPAAIRSAIMTTAAQTNNLKTPITTNSGSPATPYDIGAGEVSPSGPAEPGLIYETETIDYLFFLCNNGYNISKIKLLSNTVPDNFSCPENSSADLISNMNYPSIAISKFSGKGSRKVDRIVTNVGNEETVYSATIEAPTGLEVKIIPDKLEFTASIKKLHYQVIFTSTSSSTSDNDLFGSITWSDGKYRVRSPFVVSSK